MELDFNSTVFWAKMALGGAPGAVPRSSLKGGAFAQPVKKGASVLVEELKAHGIDHAVPQASKLVRGRATRRPRHALARTLAPVAPRAASPAMATAAIAAGETPLSFRSSAPIPFLTLSPSRTPRALTRSPARPRHALRCAAAAAAQGFATRLPLCWWDDTDFETRQPREWVATFRKANRRSDGLALVAAADGSTSCWRHMKVHKFAAASGQFLVSAIGESGDWNGATYLEDRINLYFVDEPARQFAARVASAHARRAQAEEAVLRAFYIQSMPTNELRSLSTNQVNRILELAYSTEQLRQSALDPTALVDEVRLEFARTINTLLFERELRQPAFREQVRLTVFDRPLKPAAPAVGGVPAWLPAAYDYAACAASFGAISAAALPEAVLAISQTQYECLQLQSLSLFTLELATSIRLEDFEQLQVQHVMRFVQYVRDAWQPTVKKGILAAIVSASAAWRQPAPRAAVYATADALELGAPPAEEALDEQAEADRASRPRRLTRTANLMATDSLRVVTDASLVAYADFLCARAAERAYVEDPEVILGAQPLFVVDLVCHGVELFYSTSTDQFAHVPARLVDEAVAALAGTRPLDPFDLMFGKPLEQVGTIPTVGPDEPQVLACKARIADALAASTAPLDAFLLDFQKHMPHLELDVAQHVKAFAAADQPEEARPTLEQMQDKVRRRRVARCPCAGRGARARVARASPLTPARSPPPGPPVARRRSLPHARALRPPPSVPASQVLEHKRVREQLEREVPSVVLIGTYLVSVSQVRQLILDKHALLVERVLELIDGRAREVTKALQKAFADMHATLQAQPKDIENLTEMQGYMAECMRQVDGMQVGIEEMMAHYDALEAFCHESSRDDSAARWAVYHWPSRMQQRIDDSAKLMEEDRATFFNLMMAEQKAFDRELDDLKAKVAGLGQHTQLNRVAEVNSLVVELAEAIASAKARSGTYASREELFGVDERTDYELIDKLSKDFEPFQSLWANAFHWNGWHTRWLDGPLADLEPDEVEKSFGDAQKAMVRAVKAFKDAPGCLAIAQQIKDEMAVFAPFVPLVKALRDRGMRGRHWDSLSAELGLDLRPNATFTLRSATDGLQLHAPKTLEAIERTCDKARKEYAIEKSLNEMQAAWAELNFEIMPYRATGTGVIRLSDEINTLLDDHLVLTQQFSFSPYKEPFDERIVQWERQLRLVQDVSGEWLACQRNWMYLQPMCGAASGAPVGAPSRSAIARARAAAARAPTFPPALTSPPPRARARPRPLARPAAAQLRLGGHQPAAARRGQALLRRRPQLAQDDRARLGHAQHRAVLRRRRAAPPLFKVERGPRARAEEPRRVPRDQARGLRALLLPLQR
jgi:dynein heavy chain